MREFVRARAVEARYGDGPGTRVPPTVLFFAGFIVGLWLDTRYPWPMQANGSLNAMAIVAWMMAVIGLALFGSGLFTFARARTGIMLQRPATGIVTTGPYRWSRNPMYVGFVAMYVAGAMLANSIWPLVFLPAVVLALSHFVIAREERYLASTFQKHYEEYSRRVPRWF